MGVDLSFGGTAFPRALEARTFLYENAGGGVSGRYQELDRLDAFYQCAEYDHQELDWQGRNADANEAISPRSLLPQGFVQPALETSVRERRPTAPQRLCPLIVDRFTDLLFSEDRVPQVRVEGDEDADDWLREVLKTARFWTKAHEARSDGGGQGSSLIVVRLREGRFTYTPIAPKLVADVVWADRDQLVPEAVLIQYITFRTYQVLDENGRPSGELRQVPYVYRRIIDAEWDTVFREAPLGRGGEVPLDMEVDTKESSQHRLGRFPGVWIQNLARGGGIDGYPDCHGAYQLIEASDRLYSQANYSLLQNMDPTLILSRDPRTRRSGAIAKGSRNAIDVGPQGSATYLEIAAAGITAGVALAKEFRQAALDKTACILPEPGEAAAASSAKAIEYRFGPMLAKAGRLREQWGAGIIGLAEITLELGRLWSAPETYEGNAKPVFALKPRIVETEGGQIEQARNPGRGGTVTLEWGPYFAPTPQDIQTEAGTLVAARAGELIDRETAVKRAAPLFGVQDAAGLLARVEAEVEERKASMPPLGGLGDSDLADAFAAQTSEDEPTPEAGEGGLP